MEPENYLNVKKLKLKYTDIFDSYNLIIKKHDILLSFLWLPCQWYSLEVAEYEWKLELLVVLFSRSESEREKWRKQWRPCRSSFPFFLARPNSPFPFPF